MIETRERSAPPVRIAEPMPHIRTLELEHAEALALMWRESSPAWVGNGPYGGERSSARRVLEDSRDMDPLAVFVAWRPDADGRERPVGYLTLYPFPPDEESTYVGILSAHPRFHGGGVGRDLLKVALQRTVELGYPRIALHTWPGNDKALPLYKKSGYFWMPGTSVFMPNFLPSIFRLDAARRFFADADWYRDLKREITLTEDDESIEGAGVFRYVWEKDGRRLAVTIDRAARSVREVIAEEYEVSIPGGTIRIAPGGQQRTEVRVLSRAVEAQVSASARGEDRVRADALARATAARGTTTVLPIEVGLAPTPSRERMRRPTDRLRVRVTIGEDIVDLGRAIESAEVTVEAKVEGFDALWPGIATSGVLVVENRGESPLAATVTVAAPEWVTVTPDRVAAIDVPAKGAATIPLSLTVGRAAAFDLTTTVVADGRAMEPTSHRVVAAGIDDVVASIGPERASLVTGDLAVSAGLGPKDWRPGISLARRDGTHLGSVEFAFGPPFWPSPALGQNWEARIEQREGRPSLILSTTSRDRELTFERTITLTPAGLVGLGFAVTNRGAAPRTHSLLWSTHPEQSERDAKVAAPLRGATLYEDAAVWPDWADLALAPDEHLTEQWFAYEAHGWCLGTIWTPRARLRLHRGAPEVLYQMDLAPGERAVAPMTSIVVAPGTWREVRARWRQLVRPDAPVEAPPVRPALRAILAPALFLEGEAATTLRVENAQTRRLALDASVTIGEETVSAGHLPDLSHDSPGALATTLPLPEGLGPRAAAIDLRHARDRWRFPAVVARVGQRGPAPSIVATPGAPERVTVDNARLTFTVVPEQNGRIVSWRTNADGVEHLYGARDGHRAHAWFNPWFGGIQPIAFPHGEGDDWRSALRKTPFSWVPAAQEVGAIPWTGLDLEGDASEPLQKGVHLRLSYRTCAGSNLLVARLTVTNRGGKPFAADVGFENYVAPGGDHARLRFGIDRAPGRRIEPTPRSDEFGFDRWAIAEASDGAAIVLVAGREGQRSSVLVMGPYGGDIDTTRTVRLRPGETDDVVMFLALERVGVDPELYGALRGASGLPF